MAKRVLWYSDFLKPTGFGMVAENIVERIKDDFEVEALGINFSGEPYNVKTSPYYKFKDIPVMPARFEGDMFGKAKLLGLLINGKYDTLFILQDLFNILPMIDDIKSIREKKRFKYVQYFPIDGKPNKEWGRVLDTADVAVAYTHWGKEQISKFATYPEDIKIIYHGVDKCFFKVSDEEKKEFRDTYFRLPDDTVIITNVNRNQPRKDLAKTIMAYDIFEKNVPNSVLYLHCHWQDGAGLDLTNFINNNFPKLRHKIICPASEVKKEALNFIYNCSDMIVSSTLGEGWGLSTVEAMGCETPILIPDNTTAREIVGEERGYLISAGSNSSLWVANNYDNDVLRPVVDVDDMAYKMMYILNNKEETAEKVKNAKAWVTENCDWDKIAEEWKNIL